MNIYPTCRTNRGGRGFTLTELIVVIGIIILLVAVGVPSIDAMFASGAGERARKSASSNVAAARAFAVRDLIVEGGEYQGAAALFRDNGFGETEIRIIRHSEYGTNATPNPIYTDVPSANVTTLPAGIGVAAISRGNPANPYLTEPPFAVRFDANGVLIARRTDGAGAVEYLIDYRDESGSTASNIITVVGLYIYSRESLREETGQTFSGEQSGGTAYNWILNNGTPVLFNRYTGVVAGN